MVTIKDVARTAGVSVATVSRAYNGSGLVREETRDRVREVAQRLGYVPHGAARSLITSRTHTVGVLLPDLYDEFFSEVIRGIDLAARAARYHLLLASAHGRADELVSALRAMRGRVDGLIVMSPDLDALVAGRSMPAGFPLVMLNAASASDGHIRLNVDNYAGAFALVSHLARLGHRTIAMIQGAPRNFDAAERLRGYRVALAEAGLARDPALELPGDFSEASGHAAAVRLLALPDRPTAVFAANDGMAIGALSAFREAGVRVPGDIALGGFDDIPMARYVEPPITSVHVDIAALGQRAMGRLLSRLEGTDAGPEREVFPSTLVVRRSCGAQPGAGPA